MGKKENAAKINTCCQEVWKISTAVEAQINVCVFVTLCLKA